MDRARDRCSSTPSLRPRRNGRSVIRSTSWAVDDLIAMDPKDANAWVLRGNAEEPEVWGRGQFGGVESIAFYETALHCDPNNLAAHHFLAHSYENIGAYALAAEHARRYAAAARGVPHAQHMYGHVLPRLGRWKDALAQFEKADRLHRAYFQKEGIPPEDDWHFGHNLQLLGTVQLRLGHDKEAERAFREAYDLDMRGRFDGLYASPLIEYLLLRGRNDDALAAAEKIRARNLADRSHDRRRAWRRGPRRPRAFGRCAKALEQAKAAQKEFVAHMEHSAFEAGAPILADVYVETLEGELEIRGRDAAAGEQRRSSSSPIGCPRAPGSTPGRSASSASSASPPMRVAPAIPSSRKALLQRVHRIDPEVK